MLTPLVVLFKFTERACQPKYNCFNCCAEPVCRLVYQLPLLDLLCSARRRSLSRRANSTTSLPPCKISRSVACAEQCHYSPVLY